MGGRRYVCGQSGVRASVCLFAVLIVWDLANVLEVDI